MSAPLSARDMIRDVMRYAGLEPEEWLSFGGSPEVATELKAAGAKILRRRTNPNLRMLTNYGLVVNCHGQIIYGKSAPWEQAVAKMPPGTGPLMVKPQSSSLSGIAAHLDNERDRIRDYVLSWRVTKQSPRRSC